MDQGEKSERVRKLLKISVRQIVLLNALDEFRNMGRAAISMHMTQPAVSHLLQQLEEKLGVKLFERLPRGMEPTIYGEVMVRYAKSVIHDFEHAEAEIAELSQGASGLVRIGSVIEPVPFLLTKSLLAFKAENPGVRISLEVGTSDTLVPLLIRGDLDLVLGRIPDQLHNQNLEIVFFEMGEHMSVIARPGHRLASKKKIDFSDISDATWILHPVGSPIRLRIESALKQAGMTAKLDIVETASLLATTAMIEESDMIAVVPHDVAQHYAKYGMVTILPIKLPTLMVNPGMITRKAKTLSPAAQKLLHCLKQYGKVLSAIPSAS
ncbi:MAG: putative LysR family transcriptional regulator [Proteobacteria bacterium]|nr:putative LysR family transcriptional regulator [Pseudomonadota bacterium]